jgi:hypothetical protein
MNRTRTLLLALSVALSAVLVGCAPPVVSNYASLSTHTLQVAPDKQADVVWIQRYADGDFVLMRCHNGSEGPTCVRVKTP